MARSVERDNWKASRHRIRADRILTRSLLVKVCVKLNSKFVRESSSVLKIPRLRLLGLSAMLEPKDYGGDVL